MVISLEAVQITAAHVTLIPWGNGRCFILMAVTGIRFILMADRGSSPLLNSGLLNGIGNKDAEI